MELLVRKMQFSPLTKDALAFANLAIQNYDKLGPSRRLHHADDMTHPTWDKDDAHYFSIGRQALEIIIEALVLTQTSRANSILDMPCGFGRVARHIRAAFPKAAITCSDLYQDRVVFCEEEFNAKGVKSKEDYDQIEFPEKFDLIWVGSLLTHMPEPLFKKAIALLSRSLNPNGVAIFTTQGRHAPFIQKNLWKFIDDDKYPQIEAGFHECGFGFADYEDKKTFHEQESYGITFSSPSYVMKLLEADKTIRIQALLERRWDKCQDVVVFKKAGIHDKD